MEAKDREGLGFHMPVAREHEDLAAPRALDPQVSIVNVTYFRTIYDHEKDGNRAPYGNHVMVPFNLNRYYINTSIKIHKYIHIYIPTYIYIYICVGTCIHIHIST